MRARRLFWPFVIATTLIALPSAALAHAGNDRASGLVGGLLHTLTGIDHLLAMVGAGIVLAVGSPRATVPGAAPLLLAGVGIGGSAGLQLHRAEAAEVAILASLALLLAGLFTARRWSSATICFVLFAIGLVHGYVHGSEGAGNGNGASFIAGIVLMSAALQAAGYLAATAVAHLGVSQITFG